MSPPDTRVRVSATEHVYVRMVFLAGIPIRDDLILELARLVDDEQLADRLETAYGREVKVLALDIPERETIIRAQRATKLSEFGRTDAS